MHVFQCAKLPLGEGLVMGQTILSLVYAILPCIFHQRCFSRLEHVTSLSHSDNFYLYVKALFHASYEAEPWHNCKKVVVV